MTNAGEPKTDRELLLMIHGSVNTLVEKVEKVEDTLNKKPDKEYCFSIHGKIDNTLTDHEKRISKQENWRSYVYGIAAVIVFIASVFGIVYELVATN